MPEYDDYPIETDPNALAEDAMAWLAEHLPGWQPAPGNFASWLIEALARIVAELRIVAANVPPEIFRELGRLSGVPPVDESYAGVTVSVTAIDVQGYTLEAGTTFGFRTAGDELELFQSLEDVTIDPGELATAGEIVALIAVEPGTRANNLGGEGTTVELVDIRPWVDLVTTTSTTGGGQDAEDNDAYLVRLAEELELQTPTPIIPADFAILGQRDLDVDVAVAFDLYKPGPPYDVDPEADDEERCVTIAVRSDVGADPGDTVRARVRQMLADLRETNFRAFVIPATYTEVAVTFGFTSLPSFDHDEVQGRAEDAVRAFLSPIDWGVPEHGERRAWVNTDTVRRGELYTVINNVAGVDHVTDLLVALEGDPGAVDDLPLPGKAPVPTAGTITGGGIEL